MAQKGSNNTHASIGGLLLQLTELHVIPDRVEISFRSAMLLLESAMTTAPSLKGIDAIVQALLTRIVRDGEHNQAVRLANLAAALKISPLLESSSLWSIVYVLSALHGTGVYYVPKSARAAPVRLSLTSIQARSPSRLSTLAQTPFVPGNETKFIKPAKIVDGPRSETMETRAEPVTHSVGYEDILLRDLLLIIQGEDARHIKLVGEEGNERIEFSRSVLRNLSTPMKDISERISEMGFLFRVIRRGIFEIFEGKNGLVQVNFAHAVDRELDDYYKSIVALCASSSVTKLTLRRLYSWAESEKEKLRVLARICDEVRSLRGGQVLAHLRMYRASHLAPPVQGMLSRLFSRSAAPLNRMLQRWLTEGAIEDDHGEFFIMVDPKVAAATAAASQAALDGGNAFDTMIGGPNAASAASNRIWWGMFKVRTAMLPASRNRALADKALVGGKSVAFLRRCCADYGWVDDTHTPAVVELMPKSVSGCEDKSMLGFVGLEKLVNTAHISASNRLMTLFFDKFDLSHHFAAIKRYLLLSQGDFTQALIDSLADVLDGDGEALLSSATGIVDSALRSASSFSEDTDQDIMERLNVKIMWNSTEEKLGWDVFTLTYRVEDAPLNTVFSPKVMAAYLLIFKFLWRLKRMDHLLSRAYINLSAYKVLQDDGSEHSELPTLRASLRRAQYLRMQMSHLVQNIQYYCTFEVLEGLWTILEQDMRAAKSLSELIDAHARYLVAIKNRTLLSDRCSVLLHALNITLDAIPAFHELQQRLSTELDSFVTNGGTKANSSQTQSFRVNTLRQCSAGIGEVNPESASVHEALEVVDTRFHQSFASFLSLLRDHTTQDDNCQFLAFRLDFNGYFSRREGKESVDVSSVEAT